MCTTDLAARARGPLRLAHKFDRSMSRSIEPHPLAWNDAICHRTLALSTWPQCATALTAGLVDVVCFKTGHYIWVTGRLRSIRSDMLIWTCEGLNEPWGLRFTDTSQTSQTELLVCIAGVSCMRPKHCSERWSLWTEIEDRHARLSQ